MKKTMNLLSTNLVRGTLTLFLSFLAAVSVAHNKVVIIPLLEDSKTPVFAPIKTDEAPRADYFIYSETARDLLTGLEWQRYEQSMFGRDWEEADIYCLNLSLRGRQDWRLPSITELIGITDYTDFAPALSVQAFPGANFSRDYWSSTIDPSDSSLARTIDVWNGQVLNSQRTLPRYVRCVRAGNSNGTTFLDNDDGTIRDMSFGLMWEKATFNQNPANSFTAETYCQELVLGGYSDWRVPSLKELISLIEVRPHTIFEMNSIFAYYEHVDDREQLLSTTTNATHTTEVWAVRFNHISPLDQNGSTVYSVLKTGEFRTYVKCVRKVN